MLHDYQHGQVDTFYSHIIRGYEELFALLRLSQLLSRAEIAVADPSAVLVFSGGVTRPNSPAQSEAQSYLRLALDSGLLMNRTDIAFAEDYALDSFQNLLFSLARFHEVVGGPYRWPEKITVIGFEMKRRRFEELHRKAIRWPSSTFHYIGVDVIDEAVRASNWKGEVSSNSDVLFLVLKPSLGEERLSPLCGGSLRVSWGSPSEASFTKSICKSAPILYIHTPCSASLA